ncbi:uncharacterized protein TNCV_2359121 [Trichonephila clavipes]|nr:uncharacterized protein TNCV_2359121 [Trichonephila clavipes]
MSKSTEELLLNSVQSASRRKIKIPDLLKEQDSQNVNIIVELDLLSSLMKNLLCCKYCCSSEKIELREDLKSRKGLAVSLEKICHNCEESTSTMSSKISNKCYDVNLRLTYGMRAIGKGGAAARIFCGLMNLPPPPAKFERHNSLFLNVLKTISEDSMNAAVHESVIANDNNSNIAVAVDGTWHKRGYSSLNGVVCATSVENGKWGMECRGVLSIFQRSETSRKACYTQYLGDGDSKGFLTIKEAKVYGDTEVEKLECVGHVQKRMGTRLRNILKMSKGIKLSDGKNISGRGRLTLKEVDSIQHYYGLAIRKNLSSVEDVKRAIWAIYFHKLSAEDNPQHALCPLVNFIESEKVFRDLTEKDLLKKCLHGRTQNPNESFNKCIWERIPKTVFVGIETLKFGVMDAVICFNDGYVSRIKVFEALGIKSGYNTERALLIIDNKRIFEAERIVNKVSLEARNKRRSLKRKMDKQNLDEENEYQSGNINQIYNVLTSVDSCCFKSKFYRKDLIDELKIFGMSSRHHIDDFMRGRIIGKIEEGRKITDVAREFDIAHSAVSRLWKSFKTTEMCSRRHGGGHVRSTTPAEDSYIVLSAKGTDALQLRRWQISFLLLDESRSPEKLLPDV